MTDVQCPDDALVHPRVPPTSPDSRRSHTASATTPPSAGPSCASAARSGAPRLAPPPPQVDLAAQLLEWWAYLADILTFYNERALSEALLRTARQPENVRRIVRILGYRPRPGIGATGVIAALTDSPRPFVLPAACRSRARSTQRAAAGVRTRRGRRGRLAGRRLRRSARFPDLPAVLPRAVYPTGFPAPVRDWLVAHPSRLGHVPPFTAGKAVVIALDGIVTMSRRGRRRDDGT
jgi:hypothetical protein